MKAAVCPCSAVKTKTAPPGFHTAETSTPPSNFRMNWNVNCEPGWMEANTCNEVTKRLNRRQEHMKVLKRDIQQSHMSLLFGSSLLNMQSNREKWRKSSDFVSYQHVYMCKSIDNDLINLSSLQVIHKMYSLWARTFLLQSLKLSHSIACQPYTVACICKINL